jgi:hypothetical protein
MVIGRTSGVPTAALTMPELQFSHALMRAMPAVEVLSHGKPHTPGVVRWRVKGELCPQGAAMAAAQGGRIAGYGAYDVTDTKFSTQWGPPSCSPPV